MNDIAYDESDGLGVVAIEAEGLLCDMSYAGEFLVGEVQVALELFGESGLTLGQVDEVGDCLKRIVDLVRDGGCEPSDGSESLAGMKRGLEFLLLGDIAKNLSGTNDVSAPVFDGRDREGDVNEFTVFPNADGLEMLDSFAGADLRQDLNFIILQLRRDEQRNWAANDLLRLVAKHMLGALIPGSDNPIEIFAGDGVVGRFDNSGQAEECFFGFLLFGDVRGETTSVNEVSPDE